MNILDQSTHTVYLDGSIMHPICIGIPVLINNKKHGGSDCFSNFAIWDENFK